jgi:hypothetical protein
VHDSWARWCDTKNVWANVPHILDGLKVYLCVTARLAGVLNVLNRTGGTFFMTFRLVSVLNMLYRLRAYFISQSEWPAASVLKIVGYWCSEYVE